MIYNIYVYIGVHIAVVIFLALSDITSESALTYTYSIRMELSV